MKIRFKKTHPYAKIPVKFHQTDFCYDCYAATCEEISPNVYRYGLGFALQICRERGECPQRPEMLLSIDIRPRSSVWKTGMVLSNCSGTIDEGYTGEISAIFYHVMPDMPKYKVGDRVCQLKLGFTMPIEFAEVCELDETDRGVGSYGSTGK